MAVRVLGDVGVVSRDVNYGMDHSVSQLVVFMKDTNEIVNTIRQSLDVYLEQLMRVADAEDRAHDVLTGTGNKIRQIVYRIREDFDAIWRRG